MIYQYVAMIAASLGTISLGMHISWTSVSLPQLLHKNSHISTTEDQGSSVAVFYFYGKLLSFLIIAPVMKAFGRKVGIILASLIFFTTWIAIAYSDSITDLLMARLLVGIGDTLVFCELPVYLAEISDASIRGLMVASMIVSLTTGELLINIIGSYTSFMTTALVSAVLPGIVLIIFPFMPESPYYLMSKGKPAQARRALETLQNATDVDVVFERIISAVRETKTERFAIIELFTDFYHVKALGMSLGLLANCICSGVILILFYTQSIFEEAGGPITPELSSIIYLTIQTIFAGISIFVVDTWGRRPLLMISSLGCSFAMLLKATYFYLKIVRLVDTANFSFVPLVALIMFSISANLGVQTIPVIFASEIFAPNVKFVGIIIYNICFSLFNIIVFKVFQFTKDAYGIQVPFCIFAACAFTGFIFVWQFVPETKGLTLEEVQNKLRGKRNSSYQPELTNMIK